MLVYLQEQGVTFFAFRKDRMSGEDNTNNIPLDRHMQVSNTSQWSTSLFLCCSLVLQEFFLPRCAICLPVLHAALDLQLRNLKQEYQTDSESIKQKILEDLYNKPYKTLKPVTNCTHAPVGHITERACTDNGPDAWLCAHIRRSRKQ